MPNLKTPKHRKPRWPLKSDYVRLSVQQTQDLVDWECKLNGNAALHEIPHLSNSMFNTAKGLDQIDLFYALALGIDRTENIAQDDPQRPEKEQLRKTYIKLFGDLTKPIAVAVGNFPTVIEPAAAI